MKDFAVIAPRAQNYDRLQTIVSGEVYDSNIVEGLSVDHQKLHKLSFFDSKINDGSWIAVEMPDSLLRRTVLSHVRLSGLVAYTLIAENVIFENCKIDMANFRASKFKNVLFKSCVLVEADFQQSSFVNVRFDDCEIEGTDFSGCKFANVDIRGSRFTYIKGAMALRGATVGHEQLIMLAPIFAVEVGMEIED